MAGEQIVRLVLSVFAVGLLPIVVVAGLWWYVGSGQLERKWRASDRRHDRSDDDD